MAIQITGAWSFPTRVVTGPGRIADLPDACRTNGISKPLLVTDRGLADTDLIAGIVRRVREAGIPISVFSDVKGNPTESNLNAGVAAFKAGGHDGVIAVGGGSALDVGKCVAFMVAQSRPVWDFEDVGDWWTRANTDGTPGSADWENSSRLCAAVSHRISVAPIRSACGIRGQAVPMRAVRHSVPRWHRHRSTR